VCDLETSRIGATYIHIHIYIYVYIYDISSLRVKVKGTIQNQLQYTFSTNYQFIEHNIPKIRLPNEFLY